MNDKNRKPQIHKTAYVADTVELGDWSKVGAYSRISGNVKIGRAAYITEHVTIGGGQQEFGSLMAGDFLGMWDRSFINTAARVSIGDEVGLGTDTKIYTHGNYLSEIEGFPFQRGPISIGNNVWIPYAVVLPDVRIGDNVVIMAMSCVARDLPSGCLAGGMPIRILEKNAYPEIQDARSVFQSIINDAFFYDIHDISYRDTLLIVGKKTNFYPFSRELIGPATKDTEIVKSLFRRRGIRFRYYDNQGVYTEWD